MFGDLGKMMKLVAQLKVKLPEMKAKLESTEYTAEAGGGLVVATVNGRYQLTDLKIKAEAAVDAAALPGLVKSAITAAQEQAADAAAAAMKELTGGVHIPGLGDMLG